MIQTINKSLLEADTKYIAHQCNCVTSHSAGIAKTIFDKYSWANTYKNRKNIRVSTLHDKIVGQPNLGSIDVLGNGVNERFVINLYCQLRPGCPNGDHDQRRDRLRWLKVCLNEVSKIENIESVAFPSGMGCGLAKGNWNDVLPILEEFAEKINKEQDALTYLYKYSEGEVFLAKELQKINKVDPNLFDVNLLKGIIGNYV